MVNHLVDWLVVWKIFFFSIYWECHHPSWRTHIFQRGRAQPPTRSSIYYQWYILNIYIYIYIHTNLNHMNHMNLIIPWHFNVPLWQNSTKNFPLKNWRFGTGLRSKARPKSWRRSDAPGRRGNGYAWEVSEIFGWKINGLVMVSSEWMILPEMVWKGSESQQFRSTILNYLSLLSCFTVEII